MILAILVCIFYTHADARERISSHIQDLSKVHPIYMNPHMATIIDIPTEITTIVVGNPALVHYARVENTKNQIHLVLKKGLGSPTNLIISSNHRSYIFDIVPSKEWHQDMVQIQGGHGGPTFHPKHNAQLLDTSKTTPEMIK